MGLLTLAQFIGRMQRNKRLILYTTRTGRSEVTASWLGDGIDNVGDVAPSDFRRALSDGLLREVEPDVWVLTDLGREWTGV